MNDPLIPEMSAILRQLYQTQHRPDHDREVMVSPALAVQIMLEAGAKPKQIQKSLDMDALEYACIVRSLHAKNGALTRDRGDNTPPTTP